MELRFSSAEAALLALWRPKMTNISSTGKRFVMWRD
jgi:hypothetical protein